MPNVDDHGLEVLRKAARNIDPTPKKDYAIQVIIVQDESGGATTFTPSIQNVSIPLADTEVEITLPANTKTFILRARKNSRLRLAFSAGGTSTDWMTVPLGGYWIESRRLVSDKVYVQSSIASNILEVVSYI